MIKLKKEVDMTNHTLILPSVAFGNVGQLAVDLIISSLKLQRIGYLVNNAFIPIIGADPYDEKSTDLCTTVDLFHGPEKKIVVLQIRSPLVKKPISFFTELIQFITERKIKKVVILTSSYGHEQRDAQLRTVPLRYVASPSMLEECEKIYIFLEGALQRV
ncbi:proteasome assembly chaperone 2 isoform X2 [Cephus cinctus]|uniref:Proteasome assembly chaperone 2 n=1 Tax=Cephus cinctus TaxID=211228 RepID=A0AAJ7BGF0_CEPCN|nr:proteasome assembly chaperone 2 isoform X2 [Cephus cinctus]